MPADYCPDPNEIFPEPDPNEKYRFFNQPIEQIPSYEADKPQILVHRPNCGLQWITVDQCLKVVTCMSLESEEIKVERRNIVVIKDFAIEGTDNECNIPVTDCPENPPAPTVSP